MTKKRKAAVQKFEVSAPDPEYVILADRNSELLKADHDRAAIAMLASTIRRAGGECTVFVEVSL